ncbi:asparagine synthase-related protein [Novosphingobium sp. KACC 22771]|uniref:asparagine synthase-related protein n=1 Tax=Novosphingobium sp. KACC 22771 TaxID=3025670 RepID=UPI0023660901|nr:asparagine synthase-related protein [Novosphingobium sp. KACC 22771]WDF74227.1 asparagine synthase-related protein [Novosphingobium sp. KACC 22771]
MRADYLAVWNFAAGSSHDDLLQLSEDEDLSLVHQGHCHALFVSPQQKLVPGEDEDVLVIGRLFKGTKPANPIDRLGSQECRRITATDGEALIDDFWGGYVGFVLDREAANLHVIRDPSGQCPCYFRLEQDRICFSSRADLLEAVSGRPAAINWGGLVAHIVWPMIRPQETAVREIQEVLPGMRVTVHDGKAERKPVWSPWTFTRNAISAPQYPEAVRTLRQRIIACTDAWASEARHTLLAVSGGLDSSIVAAALAASGRQFTCLTLYTGQAAGDERHYARALAEHLGVELIEEPERIASVDVARSEARHLPRPISRAFAQSGDRAHQELAARLGADQFITGGGGDNVFCFLHSVAPVADRILMPGSRLGSLQALRDVARLNDVSLLTALAGTRAKLGQVGLAHRWPRRTGFLSRDLVESLTGPPLHPWLSPPGDEVPGKVMHVAWLAAIQNHLEGYGREWMHPLRAPLMAQPIVEHCLTIPSWMWINGGQDRVPAREAFADLLPSLITARRSKGTPTGFAMHLLDANRDAIRDLLLDGLLAREGILDRMVIEAFLERPDPRDVVRYMEIMALVDVEAWLRAWAMPSPRLVRRGHFS